MRTRARLSLPAALAAAPLLLGAPPPATPQALQGPPREGRDYIYAGSRLLAVADPTQAAVTVELPAEPLAIPEGGGPAAVPVRVATLDGSPTPSAVAITYDVSGGTASPGADYAPLSGEMVVPAGTAHGSTVTLTVTPVDDGVDEADETITLALRSVDGAIATRPVQDVVLADDDAPPLVSVADAQAQEDSGTLAFDVALSAPSGREVSVRFEARGASARAGEDFAVASGVLSLPPGATAGRVTVALEPDADCEEQESLRLALSAPVNATLGRGEATGTLVDDESPVVGISNAVAVEADAVTARGVFRVDLRCPGTEPVSVDYRTADAGAIAGRDYVAASGTLVLPAGSTSARLAVDVLPDVTSEPGRGFRLLLANAVGGRVDRDVAEAVLRDNDCAGPCAVAGDLDRDGHADLLARPSAGGATAVWLMQGATRTGVAALAGPGGGWEAAATLDADGDGAVDVVWWNRDTRQTELWLMDGLVARSSVALPGTGAREIAGAADADRDGRADLLLWARDPATGAVATKAWVLDGPSVAAEIAGPSLPPGAGVEAALAGPRRLWASPWRLAAVADLDRDGSPDLVWQHEATGEVRVAFDPDDTPETAALLDLPEEPDRPARRAAVRRGAMTRDRLLRLLVAGRSRRACRPVAPRPGGGRRRPERGPHSARPVPRRPGRRVQPLGVREREPLQRQPELPPAAPRGGRPR